MSTMSTTADTPLTIDVAGAHRYIAYLRATGQDSLADTLALALGPLPAPEPATPVTEAAV